MESKKNKEVSKQVNRNIGKPERIDPEWVKMLMHIKAETGKTIKSLIEDALVNTYGIDENGKPYKLNES